MIGAIIGDIVGSRFEFHNHRDKNFELFSPRCRATDDSIMSLAVAEAILESKSDHSNLSENAVKYMREIGQPYPNCGYGGHFLMWMYDDDPQPYNSFGNGAAMRVSAAGWAGKSLEDTREIARNVTEVTHNHPEGIKGAEATAAAIYLARTGKTREEIRDYITKNYYPIDFTLDEIRPTYRFNETCQDTVPQAMEAFFESKDFEDALRNAISVGGDSDTLAAITCGIAEACYGVPENIRKGALPYLDTRLRSILDEFEAKYPPVKEEK